jgi:DNA-binding NtrC family response regulator
MNQCSGPSILIVEDDDMCRVVTGRILEFAGFEVIYARDFYEAINVVETSVRINVAVVDVVMPAGTPHGLSFAQMAKSRRPALKIIFMSACITPEGCTLFDPAEPFLRKPFAPSNLLDAITRAAPSDRRAAALLV